MSQGDGKPVQVAASALRGGHFRYYDFVMAAFVAIILLSNVLGAGKVSQVWLPFYNGYWPFGAGILFFPISYVMRCNFAGYIKSFFLSLTNHLYNFRSTDMT